MPSLVWLKVQEASRLVCESRQRKLLALELRLSKKKFSIRLVLKVALSQLSSAQAINAARICTKVPRQWRGPVPVHYILIFALRCYICNLRGSYMILYQN